MSPSEVTETDACGLRRWRVSTALAMIGRRRSGSVSTRLRSLHTCEQEQVLDDPLESLRFSDDIAKGLLLVLLGQLVCSALEEQGVAEDRRNRSAQLVGDEAEELVLYRNRLEQSLFSPLLSLIRARS